MIVLLTEKMAKDGTGKEQIRKKLKALNYTDEQIAFVRKHHLLHPTD
jgi:hypothetical protein